MHGLILVLVCAQFCVAQNFVRVTDPNNPVASEPGGTGYMGCAWGDYDGDGDDDLLSNPNRLYRNDGGGNFSGVANAFLSVSGLGTGATWGDVDNDGDLDLCIAGIPSTVYRNHNGTFAPDTTGDMRRAGSSRGWASAFGDYTGDGLLDLAITHPANFAGAPQNNHLFRNGGPPDYLFVRDTTTDVTDSLKPYTVGTWSDFDLDGDYDYFIGTGPASSQLGLDCLYRNMLEETGSANLQRIAAGPIALTRRDGQVINWIDYDNDRDLDCYITNWGGSQPNPGLANELYRNDGGEYTRITEGQIVTDRDISLASVWEDFDNDGDLDCYVTNDNQVARYYSNEGGGSFTRLTNAVTVTGQHRGAAAADYDLDGDLDLFVNGVGLAKKLFRNDLDNGNHWVQIHCRGVLSNGAAIGTKVHVKATIGGNAVWQLREISAQNSFNSHSSLTQHFGLGDATVVDSLIIDWPQSATQVFVNLPLDQRYVFVEGEATGVDDERSSLPLEFSLLDAFPNPFNSATEIRFTIAATGLVRLTLHDLLGREVAVLREEVLARGTHRLRLEGENFSSGVYFLKLQAPQNTMSRKLILLK